MRSSLKLRPRDALGNVYPDLEESIEKYNVLTTNSGATNRANLQTAINACAGRCPLVIPNKTYPITNAGLNTPNGTYLKGVGNTSVLNWTSALSVGARYIASGDTVLGVTNVCLTSFRINGGHDGTCWGDTGTYGDPAHGVFIDNVTNLWVHGVHVYRVPGISIAAQAYNNVNIIQNTTEECGRDGVTLWVKNKKGITATIVGNNVIKPGDDAYALNNTGSEGTSCTVNNTGATITVTAGTAPISSNIGDSIVFDDGNGTQDYEGTIVSVNGSTFTVTPTPTSNRTGKTCYYGFARNKNIRYQNNTLVGRKTNDAKGLGRMLYFTAAENVEWLGGNLDTSYYSGMLFSTNDVTALIRSKNITVKDVSVASVGKYTGSAISTQKDCIRLAGADNVILEDIAFTDDLVDNGTTQIAWNPVNSYSYIKTDITFQNNSGSNPDATVP